MLFLLIILEFGNRVIFKDSALPGDTLDQQIWVVFSFQHYNPFHPHTHKQASEGFVVLFEREKEEADIAVFKGCTPPSQGHIYHFTHLASLERTRRLVPLSTQCW